MDVCLINLTPPPRSGDTILHVLEQPYKSLLISHGMDALPNPIVLGGLFIWGCEKDAEVFQKYETVQVSKPLPSLSGCPNLMYFFVLNIHPKV